MRIGKVNGIQLIFNNWFIVLIIVFSVAGLGGKALAVFSAVFVHEIAHALTAMTLGFSVREVELLPFGGVARIDRLSEAGSTNEMLIAAAGPMMSLVLAAAAYILMINFGFWKDGFNFYAKVNLTLAIFNLLPGLPLDGGRMLRACLARHIEYTRATTIAVNASIGIACLISAAVVYYYFIERTVNITFLMAAVFLYVAARTEVKVAGFRQMRVLSRKKEQLTTKGIMSTKHFTVLASTIARDIIPLFEPDYYYIILVVDDHCHLQGTLTETQVWEGLPHYGLHCRIGKFV